jgi:hypothetical protein
VVDAPSANEVETMLNAMLTRFEDIATQPSPPRWHDNIDNNEQHSNDVDALFSNLDTPLLQQPGPRRPCHRRVFDMLNVLRSARLAKRPAISAMERAQRNLCRKLGIPAEA